MKRIVGLLAAGALVLSACGSEGSKKQGSGGGDGPITIAALWEVSGESDVAIDDYQRGAELAIAELNAAGGIDGRKVELKRFAASPLDPQNTAAAYRKALDADPSAMVGFLVSGQLQATIPAIERGGVPVVAIGNADQSVVAGGKSASDSVWFINSYIPSLVDAGVTYLTEDLGKKKVAVMGTDEPFGRGGVDQALASLKDAGLSPVGGKQLYDPTATDLTQQVLAIRGADAVVNWGYPNPIAVQLNQFVQNDVSIPTLTGPSAPVVVDNQLAKGKAIEEFKAVMTCNPSSDEDAKAKAFVAAYQKAHKSAPSSNAALAHDAVLAIAAAIDKADSSAPADVQKAMSEIEVTGGACAKTYAADEAHILNHQIQIIAYAADGSSKTVKTVEADPVARGGK